ncbi:hypothetical protein V1L54_20125 [Streptomyces sp. TRM 70361]|uniref:hypothetical protein n=1 Tax=Streptomyces sp. TRM 70361 TaxID=3116553 RepID=UPI002E7B46BE|nr:hypothetical protein [Streptomyces sp. TRM 70361]MEE1941686.1 hypothetical protein [Streptomyces sp. TRM 70361]
MRNLARVLFALAAFFVFWKFSNTTLGQGSFVVAVFGLVLEKWVVDRFFPEKAARGETGRAGRTPWEPSGGARQTGGSGSVVTVLVTCAVLTVMADAFFFTTWLDLPDADGASGADGREAAVKMIASVLALGVAFAAPVVVGLAVYLECAERLDGRFRPNAQGPTGGCVSIVPAVVVAAVFYGHFYVAYVFYESIGALRPH